MTHVNASVFVLVGGLVLASAVVSEAKDKHRGYARGVDRASRYDDYRQRDDYRRYDGREDQGGPRGAVRVVFSSGDRQVIRSHYGPRYRTYYAPGYRSLPPGLQKKYARTGQLPPGWQRRVQPFPVYVERRLEPLPYGYRRGVYEDEAVIYSPRSGVIIDATIIF